MFGIDDALIWGPMLGAALGGVASKKDPLKGALLGAGVGLGGAGLLGAGGAAAGGAAGMGGSLGSGLTAGSGATAAGMGGATGSGLSMAGGTGLMAPSLATMGGGSGLAAGAGLAGAAKAPGMFDTAMAYAKPLGQAASTASQVNSMFSQNEHPVQPSPLMQNQPNNQLGQLVQSMGQDQQNQQQLAQQKRDMRHKMIRGLV